MRLIDTNTYQLREFQDDVPPYAILSHTWTDHEEVSFKEWSALFGLDKRWRSAVDSLQQELEGRSGYQKIINCCRQAKSDKLAWAWIDTCCIDKASSAELSEVINSMYNYYGASRIRYAYLADVSGRSDAEEPPAYTELDSSNQFADSRWFKRSFTLQEMLAPSQLVFFTSIWKPLGQLQHYPHFCLKDPLPAYLTVPSLASEVSMATRIPENVLQGDWSGEPPCVAQIMSWASSRDASRTEDMAYSLLGIFNINMPVLYGEGHRAFIRLQIEIMKSTDDQSIFAWDASHLKRFTHEAGFLAHSPALFANAASMIQITGLHSARHQAALFANAASIIQITGQHSARHQAAMTNRGLEVKLPVAYLQDSAGRSNPVAILSCRREHDYRGPLAIHIGRASQIPPDEFQGVDLIPSSPSNSRYQRDGSLELHGICTLNRAHSLPIFPTEGTNKMSRSMLVYAILCAPQPGITNNTFMQQSRRDDYELQVESDGEPLNLIACYPAELYHPNERIFVEVGEIAEVPLFLLLFACQPKGSARRRRFMVIVSGRGSVMGGHIVSMCVDAKGFSAYLGCVEPEAEMTADAEQHLKALATKWRKSLLSLPRMSNSEDMNDSKGISEDFKVLFQWENLRARLGDRRRLKMTNDLTVNCKVCRQKRMGDDIMVLSVWAVPSYEDWVQEPPEEPLPIEESFDESPREPRRPRSPQQAPQERAIARPFQKGQQIRYVVQKGEKTNGRHGE